MSREKLIYIASPYAGDIETNTAFAKKACWYAIHQGHTPIAVHLLYPQMLDDAEPTEREIGLRLGHRVLEVCDELWLCGGRVSSGMAREIEEAQRLGIPIRQIGELEIKQEALPAEMEQSEAPGQSMGRVSLVCEHLVYIITGTSVRHKGKKESRGQVLKFHNTWSLF